ncbi:hypothetical protein AB0I28_34510 [Phytomonospora sp. NPDC050363]|uniref:hypothetical protein n=1 Tax=Phytomonospora sp. NPDC050363 TaxID=3155642 RepID=UPI0033EBC377
MRPDRPKEAAVHAYPTKMRTIGEQLKSIATDAQADADAAQAGMDKAGQGNEGFATVSAAADASFDWRQHVHQVRMRMGDAGGGLIAAADDIAGTDADNEANMPIVEPVQI